MVQRTGWFVAILVLTYVFGVLPSGASAETDVQQFSVRGTTVSAFFSSTDEAGCVVTYIGVYASDEVVRIKPDPRTATSSVFVFVDRVDYCTWVYLSSIFGYQELAADDFVADNKLTNAHLHALVSAYDYVSDTAVELKIGLDWSATDDPIRTASRSFYKTPGFSVKSNFKGAFAPATANGEVTLAGVNLIPGPSEYADIADIRYGDMVKTQY